MRNSRSATLVTCCGWPCSHPIYRSKDAELPRSRRYSVFHPVQTLEIDSVRTVERRKLATAKSIPHRIYQTGRFRAVPYRQCGRRQPFALELHQLLDAAPLR